MKVDTDVEFSCPKVYLAGASEVLEGLLKDKRG